MNHLLPHILALIAWGILVSVSGCSNSISMADAESKANWVTFFIDSLDAGVTDIDVADINRDQFPDILAGTHIYINPEGTLGNRWRQINLPKDLTARFFFNPDDDGLPDIFADDGKRFFWLEALDPEGIHWSQMPIVDLPDDGKDTPIQVLKSRHKTNNGNAIFLIRPDHAFQLEIPENPEDIDWHWQEISPKELASVELISKLLVEDLNGDQEAEQIMIDTGEALLLVITTVRD